MTTQENYYAIGSGVHRRRTDETGSVHDEFVAEARDSQTARECANALNHCKFCGQPKSGECATWCEV